MVDIPEHLLQRSAEARAKALGISIEQAIAEMKFQRAERLLESDWTQGADSPLSSSKKTEWATYRQALRDLPTADPIVWPTEPE